MYDVEDRHQNVAHRVILQKTDDSGDQQLVDYKGMAGEEHTKVLRIMPHGLASHSPAESEAVIVSLASRDMPVYLGGESPKHRPKDLPEGATMLYDSAGSKVYLTADGKIVVVSTEQVSIKAKKLLIEADIEIKGNIKQTGSIESTGSHKASAHV